MILLDSWNPVFRVRFEDDKSLNEEFEYKEDALEYAKFHLDSKPIVEGLEVYIDDMGTVTEEAEPEEIYSYLTEAKKEEEPEVKLDRLAELEAELAKADDDADTSAEAAIPEQPAEVSSEVATAVEEPVPAEEPDEDFDPYGFVTGTEVKEPDFVDPFATDFSDISEDEAEAAAVIDHGIEPVDFLNDLAKQLGIADEVVITAAPEEFPEAEPIETCSDEFGAFNCFDVEEPKTEVVVTAEVPADAVDQISSENATVTVDADGVEAPAETVSTCTVCPECGKEICECDKQESLEATVDQDLSDVRQPEDVKEPEVHDAPVDYKAEVAEEKCLTEEESLKEYHDHEDHTIESEQELEGTDNAVVKCKVADVVAHCEDEKPVDCLGEEKPLEKPLTEDADEESGITPEVEVTAEATTVGELADEIVTAAEDPETPVEFKPVETAEGDLEVKALEIEQEDDKVVISVQTEEPTEVQAEEEPIEDDEMSDKELAEKLWKAHCEKLESKKQ